MKTNTIIEIKNMYYSYTEEYNVLNNINFCLDNNTNAIILASHDSGITSLIRILLKLEKANSGQVKLKNKSIKKISFKKDIFLAYLAKQQPKIKGTVKSHLAYFCKIHKIKNKDLISSLCDKYNLIKNQKVKTLNTFQQLNLALARLHLRSIELLIVEDIFATLTDHEKLEILSKIKSIVKEKNASLLLTLTKTDFLKLQSHMPHADIHNLKYGTLYKNK